jgi:hypothetical protein
VQRQGGGPTRWDNLACLCEKHHHLKDETVWKVVQLDRGILQWTSPAGRIYTTEPETQLPVPEVPAANLPVTDGSAAIPAVTPADNEEDEVAPF